MKKFILFFCLAFLENIKANNPKLQEQLNSVFNKYSQAYGLKAISLTVFSKSKRHNFVSGTNLTTKKPINQNTLFQAGSLSKMLSAATIVHALIDKYSIDLNESIEKHLTSYKLPITPVISSPSSIVPPYNCYDTTSKSYNDWQNKYYNAPYQNFSCPFVWNGSKNMAIIPSPYASIPQPFAYNINWMDSSELSTIQSNLSEFYTSFIEISPSPTMAQLLSHTGGIFPRNSVGFTLGQQVPILRDQVSANFPELQWLPNNPAPNIYYPNKRSPFADIANKTSDWYLWSPIEIILKYLGKTGLIVEPGKYYLYSNPGFALAGLTLEDIYKRKTRSTKEFADIVEDLLFKPLGMNNSTFKIIPQQLTLDSSNPPLSAWINNLKPGLKTQIQNKNIGAPQNWLNISETPAGGLWSTPNDLVNFGLSFQASLTGKKSFASIPAVLSKQAAQKMIIPPNNIAKDNKQGLGLVIVPWNNSKMFYHIGETHLDSAYLLISDTPGQLVAAYMFRWSDLSKSNEDLLNNTSSLIKKINDVVFTVLDV